MIMSNQYLSSRAWFGNLVAAAFSVGATLLGWVPFMDSTIFRGMA